MTGQLARTLIMVRPDTFGFNAQTAATNEFQHKATESGNEIRKEAMDEFESMVRTLQSHGIRVIVLPSPSNVVVPDAVFPNNWFSFHEDGILVVYPMLAPNRRLERQPEALKRAVRVTEVIDLSQSEKDGKFLEGTGSLVLDRVHKVAFAVVSPRTDISLVYGWGKRMGYKTIVFHAEGLAGGMALYHTNVVMTIGNGFCVISLDAISDIKERKEVQHVIQSLGLFCIDITLEQLHAFCGNMLAVENTRGEVKIVLSQTAYDALLETQRKKLREYGDLVPVAIAAIEKIGGGSARCMLAEVFS